MCEHVYVLCRFFILLVCILYIIMKVIHAKSNTAFSAYDCGAVIRLCYVTRLLEGLDYGMLCVYYETVG